VLTRNRCPDKAEVFKLHGDAAQTKLQSRFVIEGRTLAKLVHPNIVLVYDAGVTCDGIDHLVMELSEAGTWRRSYSDAAFWAPRRP
jgi:serine/threonine protein kinase